MDLAPIQQTLTLTPGQSAAFEAFKRVYPNYHDHENLFERILKVVAGMKNQIGELYKANASETRPNDFYISDKEFYIVQAKAGSGVQSAAFFVIKIPLDGSPTKRLVIKVARNPFNPEVEKLSVLSPHSKLSPNIDHFIATYKIYKREKYDREEYIALFEASSCDFCHVDYKKIIFPVSYIGSQLLSVALGIASFHRADLVLRDIKGGNLLANWEEIDGKEPESRPGKVTDFGLVMKLRSEGVKHSTALTPSHAAPYIWDNILCQKYRNIGGTRPYEGGFQGKAADIFALGRTIQYDVIIQILIQIAEKNDILEIMPFVEMFIRPPAKVVRKLSDQELLAYERANPGYVFHFGQDPQGRDVLQVYHHESQVFEKTVEAIDLLVMQLNEKGVRFDESEVEKLKALAELSKNLQVIRKEDLLSILGVTEENNRDLLIQAVAVELQKILEIPSSVPSFPDLGMLETVSEEQGRVRSQPLLDEKSNEKPILQKRRHHSQPLLKMNTKRTKQDIDG